MSQINPANFWLDEVRLVQQIESGLRRLAEGDVFPQAEVLLEKFGALIGEFDYHIGLVKDMDPRHVEIEV